MITGILTGVETGELTGEETGVFNVMLTAGPEGLRVALIEVLLVQPAELAVIPSKVRILLQAGVGMTVGLLNVLTVVLTEALTGEVMGTLTAALACVDARGVTLLL